MRILMVMEQSKYIKILNNNHKTAKGRMRNKNNNNNFLSVNKELKCYFQPMQTSIQLKLL